MSPIAMNLSRESKHRMRPLLTVISLTLAVVSPAFAGIEWGFDNNGTTVAGTSLGSPGSGTATINLGTFSTGWHDGTTIHGTWAMCLELRGFGTWAPQDQSCSTIHRGAG